MPKSCTKVSVTPGAHYLGTKLSHKRVAFVESTRERDGKSSLKTTTPHPPPPAYVTGLQKPSPPVTTRGSTQRHLR
ncbi:hypothetical protein J6590_031892 [Homalodisca vitripennis]|nr:hypothetical protein J6590_031892 [Homalodisca vitripennis]